MAHARQELLFFILNLMWSNSSPCSIFFQFLESMHYYSHSRVLEIPAKVTGTKIEEKHVCLAFFARAYPRAGCKHMVFKRGKGCVSLHTRLPATQPSDLGYSECSASLPKVLPPEPDDLHCSLGMVRPVKQGPGSVQPPLHTGMMDGNPRRNYDQTATPSPQDCEVTQLARQPATCTSWASWPQGAGYRTQVFQPWPDSSAWELGQGPERPGSVRSRSDPLSSSRAANPGRVSSARASGWEAVRSGGHTQGRTHTPGKIAGALGPRHLTRLLGPRPSRAQPPGPPAAGGAAAARE